MAFICSNRLSPGFIEHSYAGLLTGGLASSRVNDPSAEQSAFEDLWKEANVPISYDTCLLRGRWKKMYADLRFWTFSEQYFPYTYLYFFFFLFQPLKALESPVQWDNCVDGRDHC